MPPLLTYDPSGATFSPIDTALYGKLLAGLNSNSKVSKLVVTAGGGTCEVQGVDLAWTYDGVGCVRIVVAAKHGLFVSRLPNATIFDHLRDEFNQLLAG